MKTQKNILEKTIQKVIKEELKPIKVLMLSLLKEQISSKKSIIKEEKPVVKEEKPKTPLFSTNEEENKINPVLRSLLEQTTPFNEVTSPSSLQEQISNVPVSNINEGTDMFANMDFRGFMEKVDEKANNNFRP